MEDKHTALVTLSVIVILAILGLVLIFSTTNTGSAVASAGRNSMIPYPGGVYHPNTYTLPVVPAAPTAREAKPYLEQPSYTTRKTDPTLTRVYLRGKCGILAQHGEISPQYTWDATYQQARAKSPEKCIQVEGSLKGTCCVPPSSP
ncbi:hypothetical protein KY333_01845 [Candidatus Woesearchaeota archaeon]|nr:hypothetical protein [Candidatus Woesearchaeota archaeon]MBW2993858.1 hypothetical protein [Candidatus Woesearchaeota archaeon]